MFGALMAVLGFAGSGMQAGMQILGGEHSEDVANYNADLLRSRAKQAEADLSEDTRMMRDDARRLKASQKVAFAKGGADISEGTPLIVMVEQAGEIERDILKHRRNKTAEILNYRNRADMVEYEGKKKKRASYLNAAATLLGGGTKAGTLFADGFGGQPGSSGPMLRGYENVGGRVIPDYSNPSTMSPRR